MPLLFHQNMQNYGGNSAPRNVVFAGGFGAINGATGAVYMAAGFTELLNAGVGLHAALPALAQVLDAGLTSFVVIEVGTTVFGRREFIGIAWDPWVLNVQHAGQVFRDAVSKEWEANNVAAGAIPANQTIPLPANLGYGADTRGPAYIAALRGVNPVVIGFMHNMYNLGDKSAAFTHLGGMMDKVRIAIGGGYAAATVVVGGDFNLAPRAPKRPRGAALTLATRAARVGGGVAGAFVNTTLVNPYDYWCVSGGGDDTNAAVYVQTRVAGGSDHAGVTLLR
jgi:endonuclease/exonuclease/phosphatase family metal-dependent hydrolase